MLKLSADFLIYFCFETEDLLELKDASHHPNFKENVKLISNQGERKI